MISPQKPVSSALVFSSFCIALVQKLNKTKQKQHRKRKIVLLISNSMELTSHLHGEILFNYNNDDNNNGFINGFYY